MVTAEIAVAMPAVVVLVMGGAMAVAVMTTQLRCVDAAREGARAAARDEPAGAVRDLAARAAPSGAEIRVLATGNRVTVSVSARPRQLLGVLPRLQVESRAVAVREAGEAGLPP